MGNRKAFLIRLRFNFIRHLLPYYIMQITEEVDYQII